MSSKKDNTYTQSIGKMVVKDGGKVKHSFNFGTGRFETVVNGKTYANLSGDEVLINKDGVFVDGERVEPEDK